MIEIDIDSPGGSRDPYGSKQGSRRKYPDFAYGGDTRPLGRQGEARERDRCSVVSNWKRDRPDPSVSHRSEKKVAAVCIPHAAAQTWGENKPTQLNLHAAGDSVRQELLRMLRQQGSSCKMAICSHPVQGLPMVESRGKRLRQASSRSCNERIVRT